MGDPKHVEVFGHRYEVNVEPIELATTVQVETGYVARCPAFPGLVSGASDPETALASMVELIEARVLDGGDPVIVDRSAP